MMCAVCEEETEITLTDCCSRPEAYETCSVLAQNAQAADDRYERNLDKEARKKFFLRRSEDALEEMEHHENEEKRRSPFLGKRRSPFLGKRRSPFLGKRGSDENGSEGEEEEKRGRSPFLGKRRSPFLGKR